MLNNSLNSMENVMIVLATGVYNFIGCKYLYISADAYEISRVSAHCTDPDWHFHRKLHSLELITIIDDNFQFFLYCSYLDFGTYRNCDKINGKSNKKCQKKKTPFIFVYFLVSVFFLD